MKTVCRLSARTQLNKTNFLFYLILFYYNYSRKPLSIQFYSFLKAALSNQSWIWNLHISTTFTHISGPDLLSYVLEWVIVYDSIYIKSAWTILAHFRSSTFEPSASQLISIRKWIIGFSLYLNKFSICLFVFFVIVVCVQVWFAILFDLICPKTD